MTTQATRFTQLLQRHIESGDLALGGLADDPPRDLRELLGRFETLHAADLRTAVQLLAELKSRQAIPALLLLLPRCNPQDAADVAHTIATIGGQRALPGLERVFRTSTDAEIRHAALYGICWLWDDRACGLLLELFTDGDQPSPIRAQAGEGLTYLASHFPHQSDQRRQTVAAAMAGLKETCTDVRFWSVVLLGTLRVRSALEALRQLARHDRGFNREMEWSVRDEAAAAVRRITEDAA